MSISGAWRLAESETWIDFISSELDIFIGFFTYFINDVSSVLKLVYGSI